MSNLVYVKVKCRACGNFAKIAVSKDDTEGAVKKLLNSGLSDCVLDLTCPLNESVPEGSKVKDFLTVYMDDITDKPEATKEEYRRNLENNFQEVIPFDVFYEKYNLISIKDGSYLAEAKDNKDEMLIFKLMVGPKGIAYYCS